MNATISDFGYLNWPLFTCRSTTQVLPKTAEIKESKTHYKRSRGTQVNAEDIDMLHVKRLDLSNSGAENKPIKAIGTESIIPQCRFCLRRVSRENLKIILRKQSTKAYAAFQIRVFHHDAYPLACSNCLNMIDIILDYKSAVLKARNLLLDKRMHLENNGWDDPVNIECFKQCKSTIEQHRMQMDSIYDEQMVREERRIASNDNEQIMEEERRDASVLEPKMELNIGEDEAHVPRDDLIHINQSVTIPHTMSDECTAEFALESDINEVEHALEAHVADSECLINTDEIFEMSHANTELAVLSIGSPANDEDKSTSKIRRVKEKKVYYSSESDHNAEDADYNPVDLNSSDNDDDDPDYTSQQLVAKHKPPGKSEIRQTHDSEAAPRKKRKYRKRDKQQDQHKSQGKLKKPRKPRKPKESILNRPPDYKPPSVQPVLCDLCGESVRPETIEGHRNRHLGIKPYNCPIDGCDWTFHGRSNMSNHMRRMHPENGVQSHKCDVCGKYIRGKRGILNEHKKLHALKDKSYVCQVCGKGFTLNRYLRQHSVIHTGLFPYECGYCGKKFNNKWSMKTHEKNMHEKKNQINFDQEIETENPGQAYNE
ncbi:zinc finger and SCAN domain-containing protein 12-like [Armigeres subalbatus]|uniref:zinc finger and SCAN domain-containing protein 12-like n=1 Tax=Armigeres subalbatus TaxID=124917 RepID=UPI002ED2B40D